MATLVYKYGVPERLYVIAYNTEDNFCCRVFWNKGQALNFAKKHNGGIAIFKNIIPDNTQDKINWEEELK